MYRCSPCTEKQTDRRNGAVYANLPGGRLNRRITGNVWTVLKTLKCTEPFLRPLTSEMENETLKKKKKKNISRTVSIEIKTRYYRSSARSPEFFLERTICGTRWRDAAPVENSNRRIRIILDAFFRLRKSRSGYFFFFFLVAFFSKLNYCHTPSEVAPISVLRGRGSPLPEEKLQPVEIFSNGSS